MDARDIRKKVNKSQNRKGCLLFYGCPVRDEAAEGFYDEVPGMLEAFGGGAKRSHLLTSTTGDGVSPPQSGASHFQARRNRYG